MTKIALVTGAGSGIGQACATALLRDGWTVVFAGRRVDALQAAAPDLVFRHQAVFLHAWHGRDDVAGRKLWVARRHHLADAASAHDLANAYRWDVALAVVHPAAHGGVERQRQRLDQHPAVGRLGHGFAGERPAFGAGHAHRALGKADLAVGEAGGDVHAVS